MPGYLLKQECIALAGAADLHVASLLDRQQFADADGLAERLGISSATWPLFGMIWPAGVQLAALMAARPVRANERILETGCGLALASLAAHRAGADITASDHHPLAGMFLARNLQLNGLPPLPYRHGPWIDAVPDAALDELELTGRFDLIIGSDVLYERDEQATLAGFISRHAQPTAEVWIVDPDRGNRPAFNRQMADAGFALRDQRLDQPATDGRDKFKGRLLIYTRSD